MLRIECPYCGVRDESEFSFGGPAHVTRPPLESGDRQWSEYLYSRENLKGLHRERWCHSYGCAQWFNAVRDTATNRFIAVYRNEDAPPPLTGANR